MGIDFRHLVGFIVVASGATVLGLSYVAAQLMGKNAARKEMDRRDEIHGGRQPDRLDRIETAVDSIAIEVERVAEAQRFLLGARGSERPVPRYRSDSLVSPNAANAIPVRLLAASAPERLIALPPRRAGSEPGPPPWR